MHCLLVKGQSDWGRFEVNKGIQKVVLVAVRVALQVYALSDEIGGQVSHIAIVELDGVNASISPDGSTISSALTHDNLATFHLFAERKKQFSQDIVVSDVRSR